MKNRTVRTTKSEKEVLHVGDHLLLTLAEKLNGKKRSHTKSKLPIVGCTLREPLAKLAVGQRVSIDDGEIGARVVEIVPDGALIEIFQAPSKGKKIRADKGLNFPDTEFSVVPLTDKDRQDLTFVAEHADMIGYSFVQAEDDVVLLLDEVMTRLPKLRQTPALVLKIETKEAVRNLPGLIVQVASRMPVAVMIARGDLAIELGFNA